MRHAFDADHIAAINNTVRKLVRQGQDSLGVGFYFSLGHSTVVLAMSLAAALAARLVQAPLPKFQAAGSVIGTLVSETLVELKRSQTGLFVSLNAAWTVPGGVWSQDLEGVSGVAARGQSRPPR